MALRWLVQQKVVSSVIIGATSVQQLEDNMGAGAGWALTDEEVGCMFGDLVYIYRTCIVKARYHGRQCTWYIQCWYVFVLVCTKILLSMNLQLDACIRS